MLAKLVFSQCFQWKKLKDCLEIFEALCEPACVVNNDLTFYYANKEFVQWSGCRVENLSRTFLLDVIKVSCEQDQPFSYDNLFFRERREFENIFISTAEKREAGLFKVSLIPCLEEEVVVATIVTLHSVFTEKVLEEKNNSLVQQLKKINSELEELVKERTAKLEKAYDQLRKNHRAMIHSEKMASIGQMSGGVAHEINTPIQFIGDNLNFLKTEFSNVCELLHLVEGDKVDLEKMKELSEEYDVSYIVEEIPEAIDQSLEGIERVANIVKALKEFAHPGEEELLLTDLNENIKKTVDLSRNTWKYDSKLELILDDSLPQIPCYSGEFNQIVLNLIINANHAIKAKRKVDGKSNNQITVKTFQKGGDVFVSVSDTGTGISEEIREKVFDPFFTTKEVGEGTGQGLALVHQFIYDRLGGRIELDTQINQGTTFTIRLPKIKKMI